MPGRSLALGIDRRNVVFVRFTGVNPAGPMVEVVTGFSHDHQGYGRPVRVALDGDGSMLPADDMGNAVSRVSAATR